MKKTMQNGSGGQSAYRNPKARKMIQNIEQKDYGKATRGIAPTASAPNLNSPIKLETEYASKEPQKQIRGIPTYQPPPASQQDWREEFKKGDESDDQLPDTKKLISQLNI